MFVTHQTGIRKKRKLLARRHATTGAFLETLYGDTSVHALLVLAGRRPYFSFTRLNTELVQRLPGFDSNVFGRSSGHQQTDLDG